MIVPFYRPWILEDDIDRVAAVIRSGWLTSGVRCEAVEAELQRLTGAKHALAMASCTAALHAAVAYHRPSPTDQVIVPNFTFAATATAVVNAGAIPLLCDVELESGGLDPTAVESVLQDETNVVGIVAVHYAGIPCNVSALWEIARRRNLFLVEDAAHALGATHPSGERVGAGSRDGVALSFYATKNATSGEGGALLTDDDALANFARLFRYHGLTRIAWEREGLPVGSTYNIETVGFKYNLSDVAAALLLGQLERFEQGQAHRRRIAERYVDAFSDLPVHCMGARVQGHAWHLFVIRSDRARELASYLAARDIGTQHHYRPLHELSFVKDSSSRFSHSTRLASSVLSLPLYPGLSEAEQEHVIDEVKGFFDG